MTTIARSTVMTAALLTVATLGLAGCAPATPEATAKIAVDQAADALRHLDESSASKLACADRPLTVSFADTHKRGLKPPIEVTTGPLSKVTAQVAGDASGPAGAHYYMSTLTTPALGNGGAAGAAARIIVRVAKGAACAVRFNLPGAPEAPPLLG
jgi:hypothetical protein